MTLHPHDVEFRFCPVCGGKLHSLSLKEIEPDRLVCSACDFVFYLDPKVVACAIVELDRKIVLLKRDIDPQKGKWVIPGGYVDRGEEVKSAAVRETEEECGLNIQVLDLHGVYSYRGHIPVVVVYLASVISGDLMAGDESQDAKFFGLDAIPWESLAFPSTKDALRDYCKTKPVSCP